MCRAELDPVEAAAQLQSGNPDAASAILQNPLFAQMGQVNGSSPRPGGVVHNKFCVHLQALMSNPAMMQQMQRMGGAGGSGGAQIAPQSLPTGSEAVESTEEEERMCGAPLSIYSTRPSHQLVLSLSLSLSRARGGGGDLSSRYVGLTQAR